MKTTAAGLGLLLVFSLILAPATGAHGAAIRDARGMYSESEGPIYLIGSVELVYAQQHPLQPPLPDIAMAEYALGTTTDGYVGPRRGGKNAWFTLPEIANGSPARIYGSGLRELNEQIVRELNSRGLIGVYVAPHEDDIQSATGRDLRAPGNAALRLVVYSGHVSGLRTYSTRGAGAAEDRIDESRHAGIRDGSPIQPVGLGRDQADPLHRDELDDYVAYLNRHPGRRIDLALTPSRQPGGVYLDYLVAEDKPWLFYSQASNTGTSQTTDWRQRFGFSHYQLTGHDDVLKLDYVTGEFDQVNAWLASYELPVPWTERTRAGIRALRSEYEASTVGFPDGAFRGDLMTVEGTLVTNVYQARDLFIDVTAGVRWMDVEATNLVATGSENFVLPRIGVKADRLRATSTLYGSLDLEHSLASLAGTSSDNDDLFKLGRDKIDEDFTVAKWAAGMSFYLEPMMDPRAWANPRTPSSSTLAHEFAFSTSGQYAFGTRLIPQVEQAAGGFYSVRGYDQSIIAGDNVAQATVEYRYHWPRTLKLAPPSDLPLIGTFRVAPQRVYGRPDWDLVLRGFVDAARVWSSDKLPGERNEVLASTGFGIELVLRQNIALRLDHGIVLRDVRTTEVGDSETHISATLRY